MKSPPMLREGAGEATAPEGFVDFRLVVPLKDNGDSELNVTKQQMGPWGGIVEALNDNRQFPHLNDLPKWKERAEF